MNEIAHECIIIIFVANFHTALLVIDDYNVVRCFACFGWSNEEHIIEGCWIVGKLMHIV